MKIASIVGTRPNFIKEFVIDRACAARGVSKFIVHTGQHYDYQMSDVFFRELSLPRPEYVFNLVKSSHAYETASMLVFIEDVLKREQPDVTLVYGDVNSTVAAALASVKLGIPVAHVEAGLRSDSFYNPEELNRRVADTLAEINFPHIAEAHAALLREGYPPKNVILTGDVHQDAVTFITREHAITPDRGDYILATIHRAENTDDSARLRAICEALIDSNRAIRFPVHPRTRNALRKAGLDRLMEESGRIQLLEPSSYVDFLRLVAGCDLLVSDSGGARREAYILGKRVISLIELVWVASMVSSGWERVAGAERAAILQAIADFSVPADHPEIFGDGHAGDRIIGALLERFG